MERYIKNIGTLSPQENKSLQRRKVAVVGCGGLGGHVIELLGRLGIGSITAIDYDVFEISNLNRQLLSDEASLGRSKALQAQKRMKQINSTVTVSPIIKKLDRQNGIQLLSGHDVIIDALDNIPSRLILQDIAEALGIPMVHGAIAGWYGQVSTIFPGDKTLSKIYPNPNAEGVEKELGNPSFTPALIASIEVSEALKILIGRGSLLRKKLLSINLLDQEYEIIDFKS